MTDTAKRLYGPAALTTSAATKYTVPASTTAIIKRIMVCNTSSNSGTFTASIGSDAAGTRLYNTIPIAGNATWIDDCWQVMATTEILQAYGSATTLTLTVYGVEIS